MVRLTEPAGVRPPWAVVLDPVYDRLVRLAVFGTVTNMSGGAPVFLWIWGIGFVVIGLSISIGRFVVADVEARRTR